MTNGEKIQIILDIDKDCTEVYGENGMMTFSVPQDWWEAEYEEPITENCIACKYDEIEEEDGVHCKKCLEGDSQFELDNEFVETITKNDLADDCISRRAALEAIIKRLGIKNESYLLSEERTIYQQIKDMPSVTPQLSSGLAKNSKKLEKDFGELDCISRQKALEELKESAEHHANNSREEVLLRRDRDIIRALPPVTPQEPRWIPVSEKLPEIHNYSEYYLVTLSNGEVTKVMFTETNGKSWWGWTQYKIVAWMPLPQAYRGAEE